MADHHRVGAGPTQKGRRFKGAHAGLDGEILRVHYNARVEGGGVEASHGQIVAEVHQKLRHQLAGRRRRRLQIHEERAGDTVLAAAVVVDDHHPANAGEELWGGDHVGNVGVHYHQEGMGRRHVGQKRLLADEEVGVFRLVLQKVSEFINAVVHRA